MEYICNTKDDEFFTEKELREHNNQQIHTESMQQMVKDEELSKTQHKQLEECYPKQIW